MTGNWVQPWSMRRLELGAVDDFGEQSEAPWQRLTHHEWIADIGLPVRL